MLKADEPGLSLIPLTQVPAQDIRWCWPERIPRGMVTLIAGYPKSGKSLVACKIAATITNGGNFPHKEGAARRGHVIIINNEDNAQQILTPRLIAAGADLKRVHIPNSRSTLGSEAFISALDKEIEKIGHLRLLILDPLTGVVSLSRNNADQVRNCLSSLNLLAARRKIAIMAVAHLAKSSHRRSMLQVAGSFEWIAACRAALLVADGPREGEHLLLNLASNLNLRPDGLAFRIKTVNLRIGSSAPAVVWKKKTVTLSAKDVLATTQTKHSTTTSEAVQFLKQTVVKPLSANEVLKLGQRAGFSHKELRTAREALGMKSKRIGGLGAKGQWVWCPLSNRKF
jgi:putative DNA primase/helicase